MSKVTCAVPSAADLDDAGIAGERLLRRLFARQFGPALIAAGVDRPARALHAVDQQPVEVADLDRQLPLPEEIGGRIGRLIAGEIEDADIDRGDRHLRFFARRQAGEPDRQGERLARLDLGRRVERDGELVRRFVDVEPGQSQSPPGHALGGRIERPMGDGDRIGAGAPIGTDRQRHVVVAELRGRRCAFRRSCRR